MFKWLARFAENNLILFIIITLILQFVPGVNLIGMFINAGTMAGLVYFYLFEEKTLGRVKQFNKKMTNMKKDDKMKEKMEKKKK